jgi:hypothetical protein
VQASPNSCSLQTDKENNSTFGTSTERGLKMNEGSSITPISSLQRYLAEAHDSILGHLSAEEEHDHNVDTSTSGIHNASETRNDYGTQIVGNKQ